MNPNLRRQRPLILIASRQWSNISQHALNSVFAFLEILLPMSQPHPWIQLVPMIIILALYLGLAYLTHTTEGYYVYSFLDP